MTASGSDDVGVPTLLPARLIKTLIFLASPPNAQSAMLNGTDTFMSGSDGLTDDLDDVAEDFEGWACSIWQSVKIGLVSTQTQDRVLELNQVLEEMGGPQLAALWLPDAVFLPRWEVVRQLARQALGAHDLLGYLANPPGPARPLAAGLRERVEGLGITADS